MPFSSDGSRIAWRNGSVAGYMAFMLFSPESRVGAIVLRNCDYGYDQIPVDVANVVAGLVKLDAKSFRYHS